MRLSAQIHSGTSHTLSALAIRGLKGEAAAPRYLLWKLWHSHLPLASTSSWDAILEHERTSYVTARQDALRAPDGSLPPELDDNPASVAGTATLRRRTTSGGRVSNLQVNNPLSLESSNPWPEHFAALDTLQTIKNDVERAFPDFESESSGGDDGGGAHSSFFQQERVAQGLTHILFVWSKVNGDIGYRQGMHEIAGAIWLARERASATEAADEGQDILSNFSDSRFIEHDTYTIFDELMRTHRECFEWRQPPSPPPVPGQDAPKPAVSAMIQRCEKVQELIRQVDPSLGAKLDELEIEPQLWAMRWIRMLFLREFDLTTVFKLWDGIFVADAQSLDLVNFLCIAMLLRIRGKLFAADNSTALQLLLRFPTEQVIPADKPDAIDLLLSQATKLQQSPTPSTGVQVVMQNRDKLGILVEQPPPVPAHPDPPRLRTAAIAQGPSSARPSEARTVSGLRSDRRRTALPERSGHPLGPSSPTSPSGTFASFLPTGVSEAAKGLYERSESLGINRALANTVTNVQRTVNAYAQQGVRSGAAVGSDGFPRGFDAFVPAARMAREQDTAPGPVAPATSSEAPAPASATPASRPTTSTRAFQRFEPNVTAPLHGPAAPPPDPLGAPEPMLPSYATYTRSKGRTAAAASTPGTSSTSRTPLLSHPGVIRQEISGGGSALSAQAPVPSANSRPTTQYPPAAPSPTPKAARPAPASPTSDPLGAL
ncbi:hypothetical protein OC844_007225 [Tilletia horrida]|nr:hypothetical protein OC844_007225 [Tilletia horrida]